MSKSLCRQVFHGLRVCVGLCALLSASMVCGATPSIDWIQQFGTSADEGTSSMASDSLDNVYVSGGTNGSLVATKLGETDAYLSKFNSAGVLQWSKQLGTSAYDNSHATGVDGSGNAFMAGSTSGRLGAINAGGQDAFAAKYDPAGNLLWRRQLGSAADEGALAGAADSLGNFYISGATTGNLGGTNSGSEDSFVAKYSATGDLLWTRQQGSTASDLSNGLAVDPMGNVFAAGTTFGNLVGTSAGAIDGFITRYDAGGNLIWSKQFGTVLAENVLGVAADDLGNAYVVGQTFGEFGGPNAGSSDVLVAKYDLDGNQQWARQFGTAGLDVGTGIALDAAGNIFVAGFTAGDLAGSSAGGNDAFVSKLDSAGNLIWTKQFGTVADDQGWDVASRAAGGAFAAGYTDGVLGDASVGGFDVFVVGIREIPEPPAFSMLFFALAVVVGGRRRDFKQRGRRGGKWRTDVRWIRRGRRR